MHVPGLLRAVQARAACIRNHRLQLAFPSKGLASWRGCRLLWRRRRLPKRILSAAECTSPRAGPGEHHNDMRAGLQPVGQAVAGRMAHACAWAQ